MESNFFDKFLEEKPKSGNFFGNIMGDTAPPNVENARKRIGDQTDNGWCQRFVSDVSGDEQRYPSAIAAWNAQQANARPVDEAEPGDRVYFSADPSNGGNGHVGIYEGNGKFISATNNGVQSLSLDDWQKKTRQKVLGVVPKE